MPLLQEGASNILDPVGDCGGEHESLHVMIDVLLYLSHDLLHVLFEAKIEHLVCLVEHYHLQAAEVEIFAFHMVDHTTTSAHKNVNSSPQMVGLFVETGASVNRQDLEFSLIVLQSFEFFGNLEG